MLDLIAGRLRTTMESTLPTRPRRPIPLRRMPETTKSKNTFCCDIVALLCSVKLEVIVVKLSEWIDKHDCCYPVLGRNSMLRFFAPSSCFSVDDDHIEAWKDGFDLRIFPATIVLSFKMCK